MEDAIKTPDRAPREACRLRTAIRKLLADHPHGLTSGEILGLLPVSSGFTGTRRNLAFLARAIIQTLIEENMIERRNRSGTTVYAAVSPGTP